jgi:hypothetical protein
MADDPNHLPPAKPKKAKPIPAKIKIALEARLDGRAKSLAEAGKIANCSKQYIWGVLNKRPDMLQWYQNRIAKMLALGAGAAGAKMIELIESESSRTSFEASRFVLGLSGYRVATDAGVQVNIASPYARAGFILDLRRGRGSAGPLPEGFAVPPGAAGATINDDTPAVKVIDVKPVGDRILGVGPDHGRAIDGPIIEGKAEPPAEKIHGIGPGFKVIDSTDEPIDD